MRRRSSPAADALARWSVLAIVLLVLGGGVIYYAAGEEARSVIRWNSASDYMQSGGAFDRAGFRLSCDFGGAVPGCTLLWKPPRDPRAKSVKVYECDTGRDLRREDVLLRFARKASPKVAGATLDHSLAVLNAFFQSGLRREIDRAVRRAREHRQFANRMPPFELQQDPAHPASWKIDGLDAAQQAIPTGLPRRPAYGAPVYARWEKANANLIEVKVRSHDGESSVWLNPASGRPCHPVYPGGPADGDCASVPILACAACPEPVMNVRALSNGRALVTRASDQAGTLLSRTLRSMSVSDLIVSDAQGARTTTLYAKSAKRPHDLVVDITHGASPPLSRLQIVNGRWTRWYDPAAERWLAPVVIRMEEFTNEGRIPRPNEPMRLALDLGLQRDLDRSLDQWMAAHAEPNVVADMAQHDARKATVDRPYRNESNHHRPAPEAGVTVLDAETGEILAVASYPPVSALRYEEGVPTFAPSWRQRLVGANASERTVRDIASDLADRIEEDGNSNFIRHPIGSTMKPILLSLVMDVDGGRAQPDGLDRFFELSVAGHTIFGGTGASPRCPACSAPDAEPIAGLPLGPWGNEEAVGTHKSDPWIDRRDFLLSSCNKFAVTFGVLTLLDWTKTGPAGQACCWLPARDQFMLPPPGGGGAVLYDDGQKLPPAGPWLDGTTLAAIPDTANAPIFQRLAHYYGVHAGSTQQAYDSSPWLECVQISGLGKTADAANFVGRVETTQLALTSNSVTTAFTNIFTGAGRNWWTNIKLAEAYARMVTNRPVKASFCASPPVAGPLFADRGRWTDLTGILSQQRTTASWVNDHAGRITQWVGADAGRMTASKTGTSLRDGRYSSTGIFAIYLGGSSQTLANGDRIPNGKGVIVIAHVDDIGHSSSAVDLVDELIGQIQSRIR